jgi:quercetin dioxygenase-like cupin family protein
MKRTLSMAALLIAVSQFALIEASPAMAEDTMEISRDVTRPAAPGPAETFTGDVMVKPLFGPQGTGAGQVTFSPGARSAWHTHPAGQTLIVTSGTGWVQEWGGQRQQMNPGDVIWTPPGGVCRLKLDRREYLVEAGVPLEIELEADDATQEELDEYEASQVDSHIDYMIDQARGK